MRLDALIALPVTPKSPCLAERVRYNCFQPIARVAEQADARDLKSARCQFSTHASRRAPAGSTAKKTCVYAALLCFVSCIQQARPSSHAHKRENRTDTTTDTSFRPGSPAGKPAPCARRKNGPTGFPCANKRHCARLRPGPPPRKPPESEAGAIALSASERSRAENTPRPHSSDTPRLQNRRGLFCTKG